MSDKPKNKKKIALIISLSVVAFLALSYFGGGYVAGLLIHEAIFGHRFVGGSNEALAKQVLTSREDYPLLSSREEVSFPSGSNALKGSLYSVASSKGTLVCVHGINGNRDDNTSSLQNYFLSSSYNVFSFDLTASGESEGSGVPGLSQSAIDVQASLAYLSTREDIDNGRVGLLGFSWGAYGVAASMALDLAVTPKAVISFSGFVSPLEEMMFMARGYVGVLADITRPQMEWSMATRAGSNWNLSALEGMSKHPEASWMLVQGEDDDIVPYAVSLYKAAKDNGKAFEGYLKQGYGHLDVWRSPSSATAYKEARSYYASIKDQGDLKEKMAAYVESKGGKETFSQLDSDLMESLEKGLEKALNS